jgi:hypothetical protein
MICEQVLFSVDPEDAPSYAEWVEEHRGCVDHRTGKPVVIEEGS